VIAGVLQRLKGRPPAALFLDFDGTLAPIRPRPGLARLSPARRRALKRLSRRIFVAVVSGRSLADLRRRLAVPGLACAGSHGLEIRSQWGSWRHPGCREAARLLPALARDVRARLGTVPGLLVERKPCSVAFHFRLAPPAARRRIGRAVRAAIHPLRGALTLVRGKMVLEARPALSWNKGDAVREILALAGLHGRHPLVYIGDDRTDEDAFRALGRDDIAVQVGRRRDTCARYRLNSVAEVWELIARLDGRRLAAGRKRG
jgi:trehalose 6-phosphate phosphatase